MIKNNGHVAKPEHEIRWDEVEESYTGKNSWPKESLSIKAHADNLNLQTRAFFDTNKDHPLILSLLSLHLFYIILHLISSPICTIHAHL